MLKIISYNLNGLRAANKLNVLEWIKKQDADIICLQEVRAEKTVCEDILKEISGYNIVYNCGKKKGYSGTITLSKIRPVEIKFGLKDKENDIEGRTIICFFSDFIVVNCYVPNGAKRLEYKKDFLYGNIFDSEFDLLKSIDNYKLPNYVQNVNEIKLCKNCGKGCKAIKIAQKRV